MQIARRNFLISLSGLAGTALTAAEATADNSGKQSIPAFELKITLNTPTAPQREITTKVLLRQPFEKELIQPEGHLTGIGGMLLPREGKTYPLVLTLLDYASAEAHTLMTTLLPLKLDEPYAFGGIGSVVSQYTVTLSQAKQALPTTK